MPQSRLPVDCSRSPGTVGSDNIAKAHPEKTVPAGHAERAHSEILLIREQFQRNQLFQFEAVFLA
ncbi:hypothetical protein ES703_88489 [subsurface metagenome]